MGLSQSVKSSANVGVQILYRKASLAPWMGKVSTSDSLCKEGDLL